MSKTYIQKKPENIWNSTQRVSLLIECKSKTIIAGMQPIKKSIFPFFSLISTKIANFYKCLPVLLDEPVIALFSLKQVTEWSLSNLKHLENKLRKLDKKWGVRYKTVPPSVSLTCEGICPPLLMRKKEYF